MADPLFDAAGNGLHDLWKTQRFSRWEATYADFGSEILAKYASNWPRVVLGTLFQAGNADCKLRRLLYLYDVGRGRFWRIFRDAQFRLLSRNFAARQYSQKDAFVRLSSKILVYSSHRLMGSRVWQFLSESAPLEISRLFGSFKILLSSTVPSRKNFQFKNISSRSSHRTCRFW